MIMLYYQLQWIWRSFFGRKRWYKCLDCGTIWASRQRVDQIDPHVVEWHGESTSSAATVTSGETYTGVMK